ncbi:hypothetical protein C1646_777800 [Rhizophagus diaphanus]|nr:hypothetical protein C1646_777800 [Rhizophagus diaphanus] [Rhizophagus sp. MUCL 43196]
MKRKVSEKQQEKKRGKKNDEKMEEEEEFKQIKEGEGIEQYGESESGELGGFGSFGVGIFSEGLFGDGGGIFPGGGGIPPGDRVELEGQSNIIFPAFAQGCKYVTVYADGALKEKHISALAKTPSPSSKALRHSEGSALSKKLSIIDDLIVLGIPTLPNFFIETPVILTH